MLSDAFDDDVLAVDADADVVRPPRRPRVDALLAARARLLPVPPPRERGETDVDVLRVGDAARLFALDFLFALLCLLVAAVDADAALASSLARARLRLAAA